MADAGNKAPVAALASPANGASLPTGDITLTATASDTDGTITKVAFYNGTTLLGEATASPYTFTWKAVPAGSDSLTAVATDNKGATGTSSPVALTVTPAGNKAPVATITAPANNATFTAPATFTVTVTATDADDKGAKVELFQGITSLGVKTASPYTFSVSNLAVGSYAFKAVATEDKGATGTSAVINVGVNPAGVQAWKEGVAYKQGDVVTYSGKTYVCAYAHTSNSAWYPGASGLWFWTLKA